MRYLNLIPIALVAAVSGVLSRDTVAQTGTAAPPQPIGSPLAPGTYPYRDAVNAGPSALSPLQPAVQSQYSLPTWHVSSTRKTNFASCRS